MSTGLATDDLAAQAIKAALNNDWPVAIKTNLTLLSKNQKNVEALNRLARAYKESGQTQLSQKTYQKVLKIDKFNPIAIRNLKLFISKKVSAKNPGSSINNCHSCFNPTTFLEEPGKTRIVALINLAPASRLASLSCGEQASLQIKRRTVIVATADGTYLGALPDDLSAKLIKFIKGGNRYEVFLKKIGKNCLLVFLREIFRSSRFRNQPTFPSHETLTKIKASTPESEEAVGAEAFKTNAQSELEEDVVEESP